MLASCWPMLSQKIRKMGTAKKRCKTQDILMVGGRSWGYVGPSWGYVGLMWAHLGAMLAHLGAMLAHLGAMLVHLGGYVAPSWGNGRSSWGLSWPMLTHLKPQDPKKGKNAKSTKHRKTRGFLAAGLVGGRGRGPSLLRRGEKRLRQGHGHGAPGRI